MQNTNTQQRGSFPALLQCTALLLLLGLNAQAAVKTWDGSSSGNWSTAANWTGNVAPVNGDDLVFPSGAANLLNTNNLTALRLNSIIFTGSGYTLRGNALTVTNGISGQQAAGANAVECNLTLGAAQTFDCVNAGAGQTFSHITNSGFALTFSGSGNLTASGLISGAGGVTKNGAGTLTYSGLRNTYTGTTRVNRGTLALNCSPFNDAFRGPLIISDGTGPAEVRLLLAEEIPDATAVTVQAGGTLNLDSHNETIGELTLQGGTVSSGTATLTLGGDVTVLASSSTATINGNLAFTGGLRTIRVADGSVFYDLNLNANIRDAGGGLLFTNAAPVSNFVRLLGSNSFTGPLTVANIRLSAETPWALGATNNGTTVKTNATLWLYQTAITNEALTLEGGATWVSQLNCTWAGPVTFLGGTATLNPYPEANTLDIIGSITGPGGLTKTGGGTLIFSGSRANTYAGVTRLNAGTLLLNKSTMDGAIPGDLIIGDGTGGANADVVRLAANNQINNNANVTLNSSGLLDMDGRYDRFNALSGSGNIQFGAGGYVIPGDAGASSTFSGVASGDGYFWKVGSGVLTLTGDNNYTGQTRVQAGTLLVNGSQPQSNVRVESGATLGGRGTVGIILGEGTLAPGASPGCLTSSNLTFAATGNYRVELNGTTPCSGYDQMIVRGTNALANATLTVIPAFPPGQPTVGDQFVILNNDGADPITGTFAGLPNGATFNAGDIGFRINYNGGTGNDVVLTVQSVTVPSVPGTAVTLNSADRGWYNDIGYHDPDNQNYYVGDLDTGTNTLRNWFVFNVPVFTGTVAKAELLINCFSNLSPHPDETYVLRHVSTPIATLTAGGSGLTNIYKDLADGPVYAVRKVYMVETGQRAIIPLNVTFLNDVTAARGSQIALGGALATLDNQPYDQQLFGWSGLEVNDVQLRLTFGTSTLVNASKTGWYDDLGSHSAANPNYFVGETSGRIYRNFFVFNLPAMSAQPAGAELLAIPGGIYSPTNWVDYHLHEVTTPLSTLTNNASGATGVFADLGDGLIYGGRPLYVSESNFTTRVSIPLNSSFVGAAFAHAGSPFALGGALTLGPGTNDEGAFGATSGDPGDVQLWLGFLPSSLPVATFAAGSPTPLDTNRFQFQLVGTIGTKQEIQASFDFENWDVVGTLLMTNTTSTFYYTNTVFPYRFFRARLLQ